MRKAMAKRKQPPSSGLRYEVRLGNGDAVYRGNELIKAEQMLRTYSRRTGLTIGPVIVKFAKVVLIDHGGKKEE